MSLESRLSIFAERDRNLKTLGFENYEEYLQSDLWNWIRSCLAKGGPTSHCECCRTHTGLSWHHRDYSIPVLVGNFSNVNNRGVVRVCSECHLAIHSDGKRWFDLAIVDERFKQLVGRGTRHYAEYFVRDGLFDGTGSPDVFAEFAPPRMKEVS